MLENGLCACVCMSVYTYVYIGIHVYTYVHMYMYVYTCVYIFIHTYTYVHMYTYKSKAKVSYTNFLEIKLQLYMIHWNYILVYIYKVWNILRDDGLKGAMF